MMQMIGQIIVGLACCMFGFLIRAYPLRKNRERGCDAYHYLLCVEELQSKKMQKKLPITLPHYFLLDIREQWYPPAFPVFLSLFPRKFLERYHWLFSPFLDTMILLGLFIVAISQTNSITFAATAAFTYALTPILLMQNASLNSRSFGSLFYHATILAILGYDLTNKSVFLILASICGALVLLSHKLSTQGLVFTLLALSVVFSLFYVWFLVWIIILTFVISGGFYWKVLKGHRDILWFWRRNWPWYGANMVKHSPVYGDGLPASSIYQTGLSGIIKHLRILIGGNPFVLLLPIAWLVTKMGFVSLRLSHFEAQLFWACAALYAAAFATRFIPPFRFLGEGEKYLTLAALPIAYLTAKIVQYGTIDMHPTSSLVILAILLCTISLYVDLKLWRKLSSENESNLARIDAELQRMFTFLKHQPKIQRIICIPNHISEATVYFCRKQVVWGAHSDNFKAIEPYFPVLRKPLGWFKKRYGATHLLLNTEYAKPPQLRLLPSSLVLKEGKYSMYKI